MAGPLRARCQVLNCQKPVARKGRNADGEIEYRSRCEHHHRRKTPTMPVGVRVIRAITSLQGEGAEVIAPALTSDPPGPDPQPGDSICLTLPMAEQFTRQLTLDDAELEGVSLALRLRGVPQRRIARLLGKEEATIRRILRNARAGGKLNEAMLDLSHEALPLAIERLLEQLEAGEPWAIKETIKGLGAFRTYRQQETYRDSEETRTLHVTFETPGQPVVLNPQNIVGVPRRLKGAVDATVSEVRVESAAAETVRDGWPGRDRHERSERQGESHEGASDSGTSHDPLAACLQGA